MSFHSCQDMSFTIPKNLCSISLSFH
jgi:hypothetical protein